MNTEQLRYFVPVARYRNSTETAREFHVTQPAVIHQTSALEREVGVRLFLRTTRSMSFARAGEPFLESTRRTLDQEEWALSRLRQLEFSRCRELRIGYLNSPSRHSLPRLITAYRGAYPQVRVELIRWDVTDTQAGIDAAACDMGFSVLSDLKGMNGYAYRKLGADFYCPVCPQEHPCLDNVVINYAKLATEPFAYLSHTGGTYTYKQLLQVCRGLGFTPASVTEYPILEDVIFAMEYGQAVATPPFRIWGYMHTIGLAFVLLEGHGQTIELGVAQQEPSDNLAVEWFTAMVNRWLLEHPELFQRRRKKVLSGGGA